MNCLFHPNYDNRTEKFTNIKKYIKVQTFWEAHKIWNNLPHDLDVYEVNVQSMMKISQIFVCFSESPNFIETYLVGWRLMLGVD